MKYVSTSVSNSSLDGSEIVQGQSLDGSAAGMDPINEGNSLNNNTGLASRQRLRWTNDLHELFVDAVAQLGGPDRKVQRLQLRIEAQGKYLKKIIEEQQRLNGVLSEAPESVTSSPLTANNFPESDYKTDRTTHAPTSESALLNNTAEECTPAKSLSADESPSGHEPLTPLSDANYRQPARWEID